MANISTIKVGDTSYGITATPTSHASTATTYGAATDSDYGHVKLSDKYTSSAGAAASGIGASSLAVFSTYITLSRRLMNVYNHASGTITITIHPPFYNVSSGIYAYNHIPFMMNASATGYGMSTACICFGCDYRRGMPSSASDYELQYVGKIDSNTCAASVIYVSGGAIQYKITATNLIVFYYSSSISIAAS